MDDHATNPHPRRSAGPQVSLANPSGFPLNAFGAIMADDHEVSTFDLRCIRSWLRYVPDRCARCSPQTEDNTDLRVGAVHALQGLFAGAGLCAQEEPIGRPAATEDFRERPAFDVVAGRTVKLCAQSGSPRRRAILDGLSADLWRPRGKQGWRRIYFRFRGLADLSGIAAGAARSRMTQLGPRELTQAYCRRATGPANAAWGNRALPRLPPTGPQQSARF
jgi:hypothetical protein